MLRSFKGAEVEHLLSVLGTSGLFLRVCHCGLTTCGSVSLAVLTCAAGSMYTQQFLCEIPHHSHVQRQPETHFHKHWTTSVSAEQTEVCVFCVHSVAFRAHLDPGGDFQTINVLKSPPPSTLLTQFRGQKTSLRGLYTDYGTP